MLQYLTSRPLNDSPTIVASPNLSSVSQTLMPLYSMVSSVASGAVLTSANATEEPNDLKSVLADITLNTKPNQQTSPEMTLSLLPRSWENEVLSPHDLTSLDKLPDSVCLDISGKPRRESATQIDEFFEDPRIDGSQEILVHRGAQRCRVMYL